MRPIKQENAQIQSNTQVGADSFRMRLSCGQHYIRAIPGQFLMVRLTDQIDPLLPRPFSIHRLIQKDDVVDGLEILYKVVGKGTHELSLKQPGEIIDLTGPLGNGFVIPTDVNQIYIAAGGIGVAPMIFLVSTLLAQKYDPEDIQAFIGGKSNTDLLCIEDLINFGVKVHTTTDDGSSGDQCLVTDPLEIAVSEKKPGIIYACGPMEMLACVAGIADHHSVDCQVSIETMMACGMGACLGCAVAGRNDTDSYLHACLDGPVFDTRVLEI